MSAEPSLLVSPAEQQRLLQREQVALAVQQVRKMPLPHFLTDVGATAIAWMAGAVGPALIWLALMTVVQTGRSWFVARQHARGTWRDDRMLNFLSWSLALQGLVQVSIVVIIFKQHNLVAQYAISAVMLGIAAGAIAPAAGHTPTFVRWSIGFGLVLGGCWVSEQTLMGAVLAFLLANLLALFARYVRDQGRTMHKMVGLTESLRLERDRAERERLRAEAESQRAHAANESRTRFFAAASHDLRQPLHALGINAATVQVLAQQTGHATLGQVGQVISRALAECRGLLDGLLEMSELDAGAVRADRELIDLGQLLQRAADDCRPLAEDKGLVLMGPAATPMTAYLAFTDAALLSRILRNLIGNAIKFTATGEVRLAIHADPQLARPMWVITVADTGMGIPAEDLPHIFEEFYQVGNLERDRSRGLGLGLSIVQRLAHLLGAAVTVHSEVARGTTFSVSIPQADDASRASARAAQRHEPGNVNWPVAATQARKVLVIDDEREVRASLQTFLSVTGMSVQTAASAQEACGCIGAGWAPDALVLDFRLRAGESGLDVLATLRKAGCTAPAVMVTGDTAPERIQAAKAAGLPLLYKPVDGQQLLTALHELWLAQGERPAH